MFAFLRGTVAHMDANSLALDVGGVGYELFAPGKTLDKLKEGENATLQVHAHIAQDALTLYGFATAEEKAMFKRLISISRVGPKLAMAALTTFRAEELAAAIMTGDERALSRVPGIGRKAAARIILELKEKISTEEAFAGEAQFDGAQTAGNIQQEATGALIALGYDASTAMRAVASVNREGEDVESLIMAALRTLSKLT